MAFVSATDRDTDVDAAIAVPPLPSVLHFDDGRKLHVQKWEPKVRLDEVVTAHVEGAIEVPGDFAGAPFGDPRNRRIERLQNYAWWMEQHLAYAHRADQVIWSRNRVGIEEGDLRENKFVDREIAWMEGDESA